MFPLQDSLQETLPRLVVVESVFVEPLGCCSHLPEDATDFLSICIVADAEDSIVVLDHGRDVGEPAKHLIWD